MKKRTLTFYTVTLLLLGVTFLISLMIGKYPVTPAMLFRNENAMAVRVFWTLRLPRVLMAFVAGFALSFAGSIYQTLFRNPLAAPDIIGVSSGASAGAAVGILFMGGSMWAVMGSSFLGGFLAVLLALGLTRIAAGRQIATFVLAGVAINAISQAILMLLKLSADPEKQLASIEYWTMGSFASITDTKLLTILPFAAVAVLGLVLLRRQISLLAMDSEYVTMLGVPVASMRRLILLLATLLVASVVCVTGLIYFIGLIAPHLARLMLKSNRFSTMVYSGLLGSLILLVADCVARGFTIGEVPVSVVTSLIGAPFLIYLICRKEKIA